MSSGLLYFDTATRRTGVEADEADLTAERTDEREEAMCCCRGWEDMLRKRCLVRRPLHRSLAARIYLPHLPAGSLRRSMDLGGEARCTRTVEDARYIGEQALYDYVTMTVTG